MRVYVMKCVMFEILEVADGVVFEEASFLAQLNVLHDIISTHHERHEGI